MDVSRTEICLDIFILVTNNMYWMDYMILQANILRISMVNYVAKAKKLF
jgi:hypothetical protein